MLTASNKINIFPVGFKTQLIFDSYTEIMVWLTEGWSFIQCYGPLCYDVTFLHCLDPFIANLFSQILQD